MFQVLLHSVSKAFIVRICVCACVPLCLPTAYRKVLAVYLCMSVYAYVTDGGWSLFVREAKPCCYRDARMQRKSLLNKKQADSMMQNCTDRMTYAGASFMHGAMADGILFKRGLKPAPSIF